MTVDVLTEIDIDRPVAEVATYAADPTHAPEWYANIVSAEWKTEPPLAVGSSVGDDHRAVKAELVAHTDRHRDAALRVDRREVASGCRRPKLPAAAMQNGR